MDIATLISTGAIILVTIIGFFGKRALKQYDERFQKFEEKMEEMGKQIVTATMNHNKDMTDMRSNYIERFYELEKKEIESTNLILTAIHNLEKKIEKQEQLCYLTQEQKKEKRRDEN